MNDFLYEIASMKHRMWHELYKFKPYAMTNQECFDRVRYSSKYEQLLEVINLLPNEQAKKLNEIEEEYFSDALYVTKT